MKKEFRITGRTRKETKRHIVDYNKKWTLQDAQKRLMEIQRQCEYETQNKTRKAIESGIILTGIEYCSDYDLLELRIESREVIPWEIVN